MKYCEKRRKCWLPAFSPFPTKFSKASSTGFSKIIVMCKKTKKTDTTKYTKLTCLGDADVSGNCFQTLSGNSCAVCCLQGCSSFESSPIS